MTDTVQEHPRLKTPLVAEVVLEIRYPRDDQTYMLAPGRLFESLGTEYPKIVDLIGASVPSDIIPPEAPRYRLTSSDEKHLVQLGSGVLSINTTDYQGYESFRSNCQKVLEVAQKVGIAKHVERLGLRFINKAKLDRDPINITTIEIVKPAFIKASTIAQRYQWITNHGFAGQLSSTLAWPVTDEIGSTQQKIAIDLDNFKELKPGEDMSIDNILYWLKEAHNNIFTAFKSLLQPSYFSSLEE